MFTNPKALLSVAIVVFSLFACEPKAEKTKPTGKNSTETDQKNEAYRKAIVLPEGYERPAGQEFSVLSWNVEHFVDAYDNPYIDNGREDKPNDNQPAREELLAKALRMADADVVVLEEFESAQYLKYFAETYLQEMGYQYFADYESIDWYMNVVVMSKLPLGILYGYGNAHTPVNFKGENGEEIYETQSRINTRMWSVDVLVDEEYSFLLTAVHLKAGGKERDSNMRMGQLKLLKSQFDRTRSERSKANMLVVGDFNFTPHSEEYNYLLNEGETQFFDKLDTTIYSHPADEPFWRIDHILVNEGMADEMVEGSIAVKQFFSSDSMRMVSDHLPLMATFRAKD